jgi:multiple sugar transport system ATP-binding protein
MTEIRFEHVTKKFGTTTVLKPLDLVIANGEFFTFVGPSGCGKSTILNIVAGLETASGGSLFFDQVRVNDLSPRDRDIAMVFQSYALYPHMTVFENIAFPLRMKKAGKKYIAEEVKRVAALLGLQDLLERRPGQLSGGQRQRVALGRAIIRKPKVFALDEPLSNIDARLRIEMRTELKLLHRRLGITTLYVTHDQSEALGLSDRIAVLNNGEIQQCAAPEEVFRHPANVFVAGFIGSPPINFLHARVVGRQPPEIDCSGFVFPIDAEVPSTDEVLLGIRPENITITSQQRDENIPVSVEVIEPAGSFNWVEVLWKETKVRGKAIPGENLQPGRPAYLGFSPENVLLFDASSGKAFRER